MLSEKMVDAMNAQIQKELFSAYLYKDIAVYYASKSIRGFANWFEVQKLEEEDHAQIFIDYLQDHGADVKLMALEDPTQQYSDMKAPLMAALDHEKTITASIKDLYDLALEEKDYLSQQLLEWFIKEQFEEETSVQNLIEFYEFAEGDKAALLQMDSKLNKRTHKPAGDVL